MVAVLKMKGKADIFQTCVVRYEHKHTMIGERRRFGKRENGKKKKDGRKMTRIGKMRGK